MDRRDFLASGAAILAAGCAPAAPAIPPGELLATNHVLGHRLRGGGFPAATQVRRVRVAIVGAGISGLSAAWRLRRAGFDDVELLELENEPGGNARSGRNEVSAYPWGAHYIPLPSRESRATRLILAEQGVLLGDPDAARPRYEERALCQAPQERLYRNGTWEEGLAPLAGRTRDEIREWQRFHDRMREFRAMRGRDGRRAFAIPLGFSSRDPALLALDRLTLHDWLRGEGFASEAVHWLANYACRDDYGCEHREVSAWAGIHYFACRGGAGREDDQDTVLTWPEGIGFVVRNLVERHGLRATAGAIVHRVEEDRRGVRLLAHLAAEKRSVEIRAEHVIWAAPFAFAARALAGAPEALVRALGSWEYAPWLTANLTLSEPPYVHHGAPLSWDNVIHDSASLGYVVATHQDVATRPGPTVLTWYRPLSEQAPADGRQRLLSGTRQSWAQAALSDLAKPHPEIGAITTRIDVFANGHAMVRPRPGLIWGEAREKILAHRGRLHFAHADASGLSLFEEANDRGVAAAESVLAALGERVASVRWKG
ncbi:MAG TPA: NAD(P)-binding protein [Usitatibacteraceae bacterium]|nr:NAD(P)-binding protein [Usitatibacteraceae bacterium]